MEEKELPKAYEPHKFEDEIYKSWEASGKFNPDNYDLDENSGVFSMVMPPPNVTGTLHLGHASMLAYQDLMIRYNRLLGKRTLWLPGTDHASIATQSKVESVLMEREGKTRHDYSREDFLKKVEEYAAESKATIQNQVRKMGSSCDWSREKYTLDADTSLAVREVFIRMYRDGLIYRGDRIVNWDPNLMTTVSDDELEYKEERGPFYYFKYGPFVIGTSRPETKFGDKYVVMHPEDPRYDDYKHGQQIELEWINGPITATIIKDSAIDMGFGTGVMTITPWHDTVDFEIAERHNLDKEQIIGYDGKLLSIAGEFAGLSVKEARKAIVKKLEEKGLLDRVEENYVHNVAINSRANGVIEPQIKLQWFMAVNKEFTLSHPAFPDFNTGDKVTLKQMMRAVVEKGEIEIIPERFKKIYFHWIDNLRDWCISRQILFGHRVPVWYKGEEIYVGHEAPQGEGWRMETDTLDTWFSSGLWTFSTLGWPSNVKQDNLAEHYIERNDLERFHSTTVLETGYDIIFFWVARMILMSEYALGEVPFKNVYLHGLVRDEKGRKMSKSLGNIIDPLDIIPKYGTDALRLSMIIGSTPGNDIRLYDEKIESYRNFVNKLYNISRYVLMSVKKVKRVEKKPKAKTLADEWILNELDKTILSVSEKIEAYQFSAAGETLRDFTWDTLADWYLEIAKIEGKKDDILLYILEKVLILWHPFTPFVTEHIWQNFGEEEFLMVQSWPRVIKEDIKEVDFDLIQKVISTIRNLRAENKIEPVLKLNALIVTQYDKQIKKQSEIIKRLARLENLEVVESVKERPKQSAAGIFGEGNAIYLLLEGIIDISKETARLEKEIDATLKILTVTSARLENQNYVQGAPQEIVEAEKAKFSQAEDKLKKLREQLESLQ